MPQPLEALQQSQHLLHFVCKSNETLWKMCEAAESCTWWHKLRCTNLHSSVYLRNIFAYLSYFKQGFYRFENWLKTQHHFHQQMFHKIWQTTTSSVNQKKRYGGPLGSLLREDTLHTYIIIPLLMEEIRLTTLGCIKACKSWDNLPYQLVSRISEPSTVFMHIEKAWCYVVFVWRSRLPTDQATKWTKCFSFV